MSEKEDFLRICAICVMDAAHSGNRLYVRAGWQDEFYISSDGGKGWLFTAYPGGRKIFSVAGKEIAGL